MREKFRADGEEYELVPTGEEWQQPDVPSEWYPPFDHLAQGGYQDWPLAPVDVNSNCPHYWVDISTHDDNGIRQVWMCAQCNERRICADSPTPS